jgi:hypothetical protein
MKLSHYTYRPVSTLLSPEERLVVKVRVERHCWIFKTRKDSIYVKNHEQKKTEKTE